MTETADTAGVEAGWGLNLRFGRDWFELSPAEEPDIDRLTAQVDARIGREPRLLDSRQKLIDMLVYYSRDAAHRGSPYAAMRWALDELDGVSVATLYTSSYKDERIADVDELIPFLQARMAPRHGNDRTAPTVETRDLPAGKAVRVQVITQTDMVRPEPSEDGDNGDASRGIGPEQKRAALLETIQYWLPIPGQTVMVVFTFTTPNLAGAEGLVAEFDGIIERLRIAS